MKLIKIIFVLSFFLSISRGHSQNNQERKFTYHENYGIFTYYETKEKEIYRELLPEEFEMPNQLLVHAFINDFYKMDSQTQPYKEFAIFLLGIYRGEKIWHCVYMPVTSKESMIAGKWKLGLPKTIGDIKFNIQPPIYEGIALDEDNCTVTLKMSTDNFDLKKENKSRIEELTLIPKINILNGDIIQMNQSRSKSVFEISDKFPSRLKVIFGEGTINMSLNNKVKDHSHPLKLIPSKILGTYYLHNTIPFRLGSSSR
ncbi:acetoacetate decarboxylase family protein [Aureibacter tunicatorum]|uniref:Acetoacetate decarboxylase n=1 Tax=Aureibacter tunicatorum TaxID=866807 RepID=A0AAE4BU26_9BACT|nr:acetoacetate decarboxylase family protein [Aureibacter tunicatorum]MDR6240282.1 hypothetical protein [Aureibacter tunicatorum]BDD05837.1 hypothetical protein AUTU_33200 [Aureibacter tunicatorum]